MSSGAAFPPLRDQDVADGDAGAVDPRFHGAELGGRDGRDLFIAEPLDVAQQEGVALLDRHEAERRLDRLERLAAGGDIEELRATGDRLGPASVTAVLLGWLERELATPLARPKEVDGAIAT